MAKGITIKFKSDTRSQASVTRLVRLTIKVTPEEYERLMALLGMVANDPNDDDHVVLESLRRKFADAKPSAPAEGREGKTVEVLQKSDVRKAHQWTKKFIRTVEKAHKRAEKSKLVFKSPNAERQGRREATYPERSCSQED